MRPRPEPDAPLAAGVAAIALAGTLLALGIGPRRPGAAVLALAAVLGALPALAAAAVARHPTGWLPGGWWRRGALAAVLVGGAALRFRGLGWSLPYVPHPDEPAVVNIAQRMLVTGDLDPHRYTYPSLYIYLQALVYLPQLLWGFAQGAYRSVDDLPATTDAVTTAPGIYLWGRALTAALATGTILLTYGAGRRLYGPGVGLVAALLLAFEPATIEDTHLITVDVPSAAFTALAFFWIAGLYRAGFGAGGAVRWGLVARAGVGVGLAAATKYNAAAIAAPFLLAPLLRGVRAPWRVWLVGALAAAATFLLATPFAIPKLPYFLNDTAAVIAHYKFDGHGIHTGDHNWRYYAAVFWRNDGWLFVLALAGLALMALRHRRADLLTLAFPLFYYGALTGLKVNFPRNLMPLYPFLAIAAAVALLAAARLAAPLLSRIAQTAHRSPPAAHRIPHAAFALLVLPLVLVGPVADAGNDLHWRTGDDSRAAAQRWIERNVPPDSYWLVELPPEPWRARSNVISTALFGPLPQHPPDWYPTHGFGYLLLDRAVYGPFLRDRARYGAEAAWYDEALRRFTVVREWPPVLYGDQLTLLSTGLDLSENPPLQERRDARFGAGDGAIALLGYNLGPLAPTPGTRPAGPYFPDDGAGARAPFRPGETLGLTLLWRPLHPLTEDYSLFVHLRDAAGRTVAQRDDWPRHGTYQTSAWRAGEPLLDEANLALPATLAPGRYTLVLGLAPPDRSRLPVRPAPGAAPAPGDELVLATIDVVR
jgi:hypothetical protein